jgi:sterol desaturase/sphingolipid hydroxylase (fatty acid hydroxylase superfamily)
MSKIDPLSYAIEGTIFKKILQICIFPVFMTLTVVIGFELIKNGYYSRETSFGTVLTLLCMGVIFAPLERLIPFSRKWTDDKDEPTDVMVYFGNHFFERYIMSPFYLATLALVIQEISPQIGQAIWPSHWHPLVQVFLLLAVKDFFRYWYHRWMHENDFMWRWHSVHHSSTRLYWFNSNRAHPIEFLVQGFLWGIPLAFVQAPVEIVFVTSFLGTMISRFQHTNLDLILGPMEYVFSGPKNHRYHHSKKIEEGNSNYGGDVMLWDLLFGTFHLPQGKQPSDDIGVGEMPDYPQTWVGLMLAPFTFGNYTPAVQKAAERPELKVMEELPPIDPERKQA